MYGYIYETTNLINGKKYIGQHKSDIFDKNYLGSGKYLKRAIDKYGLENFQCKIIQECNSREELDAQEVYYIKKLNAVESDEYYNIGRGGEGWQRFSFPGELNGRFGKPIEEETKKKISEALMGNKPWNAENNERVMEYKEKLSKMYKGKERDGETRKNISKGTLEAMRKFMDKDGNCVCGTFGKKAINNGEVQKYVKPEEIDKYLEQGWTLGPRKRG